MVKDYEEFTRIASGSDRSEIAKLCTKMGAVAFEKDILSRCRWGLLISKEAMEHTRNPKLWDSILFEAATPKMPDGTRDGTPSFPNLVSVLSIESYSPSDATLLLALEQTVRFSSASDRLELLMQHLMDIAETLNKTTSDDSTLLIKAADKGNHTGALMLFENGADPRKTVKGISVFDVLKNNGLKETEAYRQMDAFMKTQIAVSQEQAVSQVRIAEEREVAAIRIENMQNIAKLGVEAMMARLEVVRQLQESGMANPETLRLVLGTDHLQESKLPRIDTIDAVSTSVPPTADGLNDVRGGANKRERDTNKTQDGQSPGS